MLTLKIENEILKNLHDEFQAFAKIFTGKIAELKQKIKENNFLKTQTEREFKLTTFQKEDEINNFKNELITRNKEKLLHEIQEFKKSKKGILENLESRFADLHFKNQQIERELQAINEVKQNFANINHQSQDQSEQGAFLKISLEMQNELAMEEHDFEIRKLVEVLKSEEIKKLELQKKMEEMKYELSNPDKNILESDVFAIQKFKNTLNFLNTQNLSREDDQMSLNNTSGQYQNEGETMEHKILNLKSKAKTLKEENNRLKVKIETANFDKSKKVDEFERIMKKMKDDFSAKKSTSQNLTNILKNEDEKYKNEMIQKQTKISEILEYQKFMLEQILNASTPACLARFWEENQRQLQQCERTNSPKICHQSSQKNIIMGSELFDDFVSKKSVENSGNKRVLRYVRSQSPSRMKNNPRNSHMIVQNIDNLGEIESIKFENNSEVTEIQFSNAKKYIIDN